MSLWQYAVSAVMDAKRSMGVQGTLEIWAAAEDHKIETNSSHILSNFRLFFVMMCFHLVNVTLRFLLSKHPPLYHLLISIVPCHQCATVNQTVHCTWPNGGIHLRLKSHYCIDKNLFIGNEQLNVMVPSMCVWWLSCKFHKSRADVSASRGAAGTWKFHVEKFHSKFVNVAIQTHSVHVGVLVVKGETSAYHPYHPCHRCLPTSLF